jgi:hypothetical protein
MFFRILFPGKEGILIACTRQIIDRAAADVRG